MSESMRDLASLLELANDNAALMAELEGVPTDADVDLEVGGSEEGGR